eukprot:10467-Heterococcus_DN1.PRE.5
MMLRLRARSKSNVCCSWYSHHTILITLHIDHALLCIHHTTGMQKAYNFLWGSHGLADDIRASEPGCAYMSNADVISIVGYVAVVQSGGAPDCGCNWYPGRVDYVGFDDTSRLPFEGFNATQMQDHWARYDFFDAQRTLGLCLAGIGPLSNTPFEFNGEYFSEVINGLRPQGLNGVSGWFKSDHHGLCNNLRVKTDAEFIEDSSTDAPVPADPIPLTEGPDLEKLICNDSESEFASLYQRYSNGFRNKDDSLFQAKFCDAYQGVRVLISTLALKRQTSSAVVLVAAVVQ